MLFVEPRSSTISAATNPPTPDRLASEKQKRGSGGGGGKRRRGSLLKSARSDKKASFISSVQTNLTLFLSNFDMTPIFPPLSFRQLRKNPHDPTKLLNSRTQVGRLYRRMP